jgi:hypothetical protein
VIDTHFQTMLARWLGDGLTGAALVDRRGQLVAIAGSIDPAEATPLAALVMHRLKADDLAERLFAGEMLTLTLERNVAVGVAKRQLFVVAILASLAPAALELAARLRDNVATMLADATDYAPQLWRASGGGGSGSGPADLPLVELGITVPRAKA